MTAASSDGRFGIVEVDATTGALTSIGDGTGASPASAFRDAMALLASGLTMVTTRIDGRAWGLTISSCTSLSADPPQVLVSLGTRTVTCRQIATTRRFGLSLLGAHHHQLAQVGAAPGAPKFVDDHCEDDGEERCPRVRGALYHLDCDVSHVTAVADHTIFVGQVTRWVPGALSDSPEPLIYFDRGYRGVTANLL
jgi:flavin reductase (DIM6/NTAB) family NADH-FMN oxidoreductase RutF